MSDVINHEEARLLAAMKQADSNLSRCYLALTAELTRLTSQVAELRIEVDKHQTDAEFWKHNAEERQASLEAVTRERDEARAEFNIQCRAIGNWREWGNKPESDHGHPDWKVATKAILERDEARAALLEYACTGIDGKPCGCSAVLDGDRKRAETAEAAAGAMREALEDLVGVFGSRIKFDRDQEPMLAAKVDRARSALLHANPQESQTHPCQGPPRQARQGR